MPVADHNNVGKNISVSFRVHEEEKNISFERQNKKLKDSYFYLGRIPKIDLREAARKLDEYFNLFPTFGLDILSGGNNFFFFMLDEPDEDSYRLQFVYPQKTNTLSAYSFHASSHASLFLSMIYE